jgi:hypothetical protein
MYAQCVYNVHTFLNTLHLLPVNFANQINVQYPYVSPHPAFYQQQDLNTYIQPNNSNKRSSAHHNNQISQLDNPSPSLIKFLEQNNLAEHQHQLLNSQLLNSQMLNVQLAKSQANQLQPEAVHSSQNMAKPTVQNTIRSTAQVPTQISTISAMIPTKTTIKILPTVATTNSSSFPTGLSSKMPKIAKS